MNIIEKDIEKKKRLINYETLDNKKLSNQYVSVRVCSFINDLLFNNNNNNNNIGNKIPLTPPPSHQYSSQYDQQNSSINYKDNISELHTPSPKNRSSITPFSAIRLRDYDRHIKIAQLCEICKNNIAGNKFCIEISEFITNFTVECTYTSLIGWCKDERHHKKKQQYSSPAATHALKKLNQRLNNFENYLYRGVFAAFEHLTPCISQLLSHKIMNEIILPKVHISLIELYRQAYKNYDEKFNRQMKLLSSPGISPLHFGVNGFTSTDKISLDDNNIYKSSKRTLKSYKTLPKRANTTHRRLFQSMTSGFEVIKDLYIQETGMRASFCRCFKTSIECIKDIQNNAETAKDKLECVLNCFRSIAEDGQQHLNESIGTDLLLPILSFVIVCSNVRNLHSECKFIQDLLPSHILDTDHEAAFCLGSLIGMIEWLTEMNMNEHLEKPLPQYLLKQKSSPVRRRRRSDRRSDKWRKKHVERLVFSLHSSTKTSTTPKHDRFNEFRQNARSTMQRGFKL